jgi:DNA-binding NarL/FixJ family response regulator
MTKVALADDHTLLRNGLASLIESFGEYKVLFQADNGKQFIEKMKSGLIPDLVLMDIKMPVMDGHETALWLQENYPDIKILSLSMYDDEHSIIKMFKAGAKGYILKDCDPSELRAALHAIVSRGFYYSEMVTGNLIHSINEKGGNQKNKNLLNARETEFLKLAATELTYKEIADKLSVSPRTVDGYRDGLFEKLNVKTRVGLVMYAIKNGIVDV